jgi:hypothetical protein
LDCWIDGFLKSEGSGRTLWAARSQLYTNPFIQESTNPEV